MLPNRQLGRKPATDEMRKKTLPLRNFVNLAARPVPTTDDYASKAQDALTKMMDNDREGCCVATALAKFFGLQNAYRPGGSVVVATDSEVSKFYHAVGGPGDNGLYMPDAFEYAIKHGFTIAGQLHKLEGYAAVDVSDSALVDAAHHWFYGLQLGVNLTREQYVHCENTDTWDLDGSPVVGGHAVPLTKRGSDKFQLATWARQPGVTRRAVQSPQWAEEAYVLFGPDSFDHGIDTNAVNVDALRAALKAIKNGGTPDIPDDPNPPPGPGPGPGPGPVPSSFDAEGTLEVFGQLLPIKLHGTFKGATGGLGAVPIWQLAMDVWALWVAFQKKDWAAFADAVQKLITDLGLKLTPEEQSRMVEAMKLRFEVAPLD